MKLAHINQIIDNPQIDYSFITKEIDKRIEYPIFKIKERSVIDQQSGQRFNYATHFCGSCNHKFEGMDDINNNVQCPNCGNMLSGYSNCKLEGIEDDFEFTERDKILILREEDCRNDYYRENGYGTTIPVVTPSKKTAKYTRFFLLEKHLIDNETYIALRFYKLNTLLDIENKQKAIYLIDTGNIMIFGKNEIIPVRDFKKSTAKFLNLFNDYWNYYAEINIVIAQENEIEELKNLILNFKGVKIGAVSPLEQCNDRKIAFVHLDRFDKINTVLKNSNKKVKVPNKIDKLIDDITSSIPQTKPFTIQNDNIFLKSLEEDKIACITKYKFFCPFCKQDEEIDIPDKYFYSDDIDFIPTCPDCHTELKKKNIKKFFAFNNKEVLVQVIDNYNDGIIVFGAYYKQTLQRNTLVYEPINRKQDFDIIVIPNKINADTGLADPIILRYNYVKGSYGKARSFSFGLDSQDRVVKNFATNFNLNWSGIDLFPFNDNPSADRLGAFALLYRKYPVLEKLMKEGHHSIVTDIIHTYNYTLNRPNATYDISANDVPSVLKISRNCVNILKEFTNFHHSEAVELLHLQALYGQDKNITREQYAYMQEYYLSETKVADLCRLYGFTIHQICNYLERVRISQCVAPSTALSEWADYLYASQLIGCDIKDKKVRYPSALRTEHDKVVYKKKIIEDEKYDNIFKESVEKYGEKLSFKSDGFLITYPKEISDLFEEGRKLNHCAGFYGDRIKDGESIILFVRNAKEPDEPFYTMEVNPRYNSVVQLHGFNNSYPNPKTDKALISFVKKWAANKKIAY